MKTIHCLMVLSLISTPLAGCDPLFEGKDDGDTAADGTNEEEDGEEEEDDEEDDEATTGEGEGEVMPPELDVVTAFAIRHGDLPPLDVGGDSGGDSGGDGGTSIDPDALLVVITNGAATCEQPFAANECGTRWSVSFTLPPELQQPGSYALWPDLNGGFSVTGELYPEGDCSWGGGTLEGVVEITEIVDGVVTGSIHDAWAIDFDPNLAFEATSCA